MSRSALNLKVLPFVPQVSREAISELVVQPLTAEAEAETLSFLEVHPLQSIFLAGLIRDNGLVNPHNRGTFYACRDRQGNLQGVALIGHAVVFEARSEAVIAAFAEVAQECATIHLIMAPEESIDLFWNYFASPSEKPRVILNEILYAQRFPVAVHEAVPELRRATLADLDQIMTVHAQMVYEESGTNPLELDPVGFRARCARRVEQGRAWVWFDQGRLVFKADIVRDTPEAIYLEGVYVTPEERRKGYGVRCLSQLSRNLLMQARSICLLVDEYNYRARTCYQRAGYKQQGLYKTFYLD